jgi:ATP-dependent Clp protease adaptor protein ClpS
MIITTRHTNITNNIRYNTTDKMTNKILITITTITTDIDTKTKPTYRDEIEKDWRLILHDDTVHTIQQVCEILGTVRKRKREREEKGCVRERGEGVCVREREEKGEEGRDREKKIRKNEVEREVGRDGIDGLSKRKEKSGMRE